MNGLIDFVRRFGSEEACVKALADLRWPSGFTCGRCKHDRAHHLKSRPRVSECAACGHQNSGTVGTVFHKTRTDLSKWFLAAYLMATDKRGVSAMYVSRELSLRGGRRSLYGGYREKGRRGRARNPKKAMMALAVERRYVKLGKKWGWVMGAARIEVIANADSTSLTAFMRRNVVPGTRVQTDGWKGYNGLAAAGYTHTATVSPGALAGENLPFVHLVFSNLKAWLNGTFHGVSNKHLPAYLREWSYRFNRRHGGVAAWVLARMATQPGVTYAALTA